MPALQNQVVFQLTNLRTAFDAHFLILYHTELLTSQSHTTSSTREAISMIKFFTISYKFDTSFYQLFASCTPLCKIIAVAILTNITSLMLGKWLSCQWLCANCTSEAFWVVHVAIMLYWSSFYRLITPDTDLQNKFQHVINQFVTPVKFFFLVWSVTLKLLIYFQVVVATGKYTPKPLFFCLQCRLFHMSQFQPVTSLTEHWSCPFTKELQGTL